MKVDVEGFEAAVFRGPNLSERLRRDRPILLVEISGTDRSGFGDVEGLTEAIYEDFELFAVGCTSISGTYRITTGLFRKRRGISRCAQRAAEDFGADR